MNNKINYILEKIRRVKSDMHSLERHVNTLHENSQRHTFLSSDRTLLLHEIQQIHDETNKLEYEFSLLESDVLELNIQAETKRESESLPRNLGIVAKGLGNDDGFLGTQRLEAMQGIIPRDLRQSQLLLLEKFGHYPCYATLLALPSDKEAIRYFTDFSRELEILSAKNCLIIGIGKKNSSTQSDSKDWEVTINEQVYEGYSMKVAHIFDIQVDKFPCLLIFQDLRSSDHVIINLKDLTAEQISQEFRPIFSAIKKAGSEKESPLKALVQLRVQKHVKNASKSIISELKQVAGHSFDKLAETLVSATIESLLK